VNGLQRKGGYSHFAASSFIMDPPLTVNIRHDGPPDLEPQGFLLVPGCPSPSPDEEEANEGTNINDSSLTQFSCHEYVQKKTNNGSDLSQKVAILFTMRIGLDDSKFPFFVDREPFISLPKQNKIRINQQVLGEEIVRRCNEYVLDTVKPAQWKKDKQMTWLKKNPIPSIATADLEFIKTSLQQLTKFAEQLVDNAKVNAAHPMRKNWTSILPWLRFYLALVHPKVRPLFLLCHTPKSISSTSGI
jgi:hypothetical protein